MTVAFSMYWLEIRAPLTHNSLCSPELKTSITGEVAIAIITAVNEEAMPATTATNGETGHMTTEIDGAITKSTRNSETPGSTLSRYSILDASISERFTHLDYALPMAQSVPVLLVCDDEFAPLYAKSGDAGADLRSVEELVLKAGERKLVKTGVKIALPDGYVGLVHPRSGLAAKHGITVLNTPGTVDSGYRGEIMVILFNSSEEDFEIAIGDRIAQLVIQEYVRAEFVRVQELPESDRSETGFGSSGKR